MSYKYTLEDLYKDIVIGIPSEVTKYLFNRIQQTNYRGEHLSQHNRYTRNTIITILQELNKILKDNNLTLLKIRTTDMSKQPINTPDELYYALLTNSIAAIEGRITQDSLRKNFFVDMARMGLIKRFKPNGIESNPFSQSRTKFVCITDLGYKLLEKFNTTPQNPFEINRIWTDALTNLHNGFENLLYSFMLDLQANEHNSINYNEFAFFVSDIRNVSSEKILTMLLEFKRLSLYQREAIINSIKKYANPKENNIFNNLRKTQIKDYHNWINEAQQLFMLLNDSVLFGIGDFKEKELNIRTGNLGLIQDNEKRLQRSSAQKNQYYIQHNLDKQNLKGLGYELHHIIPLAYARNQNEFSMLDKWENMILIDGHSHAKITQNGSKNILLDFNNFDIIFKDYNIPPNIVECIYNQHVKYNTKLKNLMLSTNKSLLNSI
ncbi:type II restriction endonuclease subunit R [Campylobacter lari]|nr:type II restriction endonuclease subunit R [Campylobacter lari]EBF6064486.1 type II restriction endonuclease subunit R [Campylobacter lari]MCH3717560.1 type II restriction endonuclease subunit R [Campylobacter lari]